MDGSLNASSAAATARLATDSSAAVVMAAPRTANRQVVCCPSIVTTVCSRHPQGSTPRVRSWAKCVVVDTRPSPVKASQLTSTSRLVKSCLPAAPVWRNSRHRPSPPRAVPASLCPRLVATGSALPSSGRWRGGGSSPKTFGGFKGGLREVGTAVTYLIFTILPWQPPPLLIGDRRRRHRCRCLPLATLEARSASDALG